MSLPRILLNDIGLKFRVRSQGRISLRECFLQASFLKRSKNYAEVQALNHVNLRVEEGERLGVIGHNGAGKSTLLKLLAGVYTPSVGTRTVHGRISSLFEISLGFEMEASGWDNIKYRGYLQGETPKTIKSKIEPIAEFSELGDFLNIPVRYYSSGMLVRLAFAIATSIKPEILLVDEALGAGDLAFQKKAKARIGDLMSQAKAVVVVSHDLPTLKSLCETALWLDHGTVRMIGPANDVIEAYSQSQKTPQSGFGTEPRRQAA